MKPVLIIRPFISLHVNYTILERYNFELFFRISIHKNKKDKKDDDDEEKYLKNPTYKGTLNKNSTSSATYETVNLSDSTKITIESEQTYAVPDKQ